MSLASNASEQIGSLSAVMRGAFVVQLRKVTNLARAFTQLDSARNDDEITLACIFVQELQGDLLCDPGEYRAIEAEYNENNSFRKVSQGMAGQMEGSVEEVDTGKHFHYHSDDELIGFLREHFADTCRSLPAREGQNERSDHRL